MTFPSFPQAYQKELFSRTCNQNRNEAISKGKLFSLTLLLLTFIA